MFSPARQMSASYRSGPDTSEYGLKAAFIFKFVRYTRWPKDAFKDPKAPLLIAIVGHDPFGKKLTKIFGGKTIGKRRVIFRHYKTAKDIGAVHVLILGKLDAKERKRCIKKVAKLPVLTIADTGGVMATGAMIGFYLDGKRIRFEIAPSRVKAARLKMSSQLFRLAKIVRPKK